MIKRIQKLLGKENSLFYLLLAVAALIYALFSCNSTVWADEAYTFALIRHSFREVWNITAADVHPPLYYFLLKLFSMPFGYNLWVCRFLSALPCLLLMGIGGWQLKKLFGEKTALLFMLLYFMFPYLMDYAAEVRMYSLAGMFIFFNAMFAYRCWKWNKLSDWIGYTLCGVGAAYTHYFALVSAAVVYGLLLVFALFKKKQLLKGWLLASVATIVLYIPWLSSFISQVVYKVNNEYWIEPITVSTIFGYVKTVLSASGMGCFVMFSGIVFAFALVWMFINRSKEDIWICLCALAVPLGTVVLGLVASFLVRPIFVIRYILPSLPLVLFFLAYVLARMENKTIITVLLTIMLTGGISNLTIAAKDSIIRDPNRIDISVITDVSDLDAVVTLSGNTLHAGQEIAHFAPGIQVYTTDLLGRDNPYPNRVPMDQFDPTQNDTILLVLSVGEEVPSEYTELYTAEFYRHVSVSGVGQDIWLLRHK